MFQVIPPSSLCTNSTCCIDQIKWKFVCRKLSRKAEKKKSKHLLFQKSSICFQTSLPILFHQRVIRLRWDPKDYGDIDHFYVNIDEIWVPELTILAATQAVDYRENYKKVAIVRV